MNLDNLIKLDVEKKLKYEPIDEKIKSEIYYFDEEGNNTDKEHAVSAIIRELDENGNVVRENFGFFGNKNKNINSKRTK